ncbi:hypothetical protein F5B21DRAFT_526353 [Xylaria acuta]|nr:hypothetical protein F5B21DRAFT_526353 [Xylaria acuta]
MITSDTESGNGLKIINAALFHMGTWSMAKAPPFTRDDWDELWGNEYDAVCDTAAPFTLELFQAYPGAKVVIVQRDYDSWWPSFQTDILDNLFAPFTEFQIFLGWHLMGLRAGHAMRKLLLGFFNARTKAEIEAHGRETYDRFSQEIQDNVLPERRLEYKIGSGWEPLCGFLGKDVPDVPFPISNDRKAHAKDAEWKRRKVQLAMLKAVALGIMSVAAVGAGWWFLV